MGRSGENTAIDSPELEEFFDGAGGGGGGGDGGVGGRGGEEEFEFGEDEARVVVDVSADGEDGDTAVGDA